MEIEEIPNCFWLRLIISGPAASSAPMTIDRMQPASPIPPCFPTFFSPIRPPRNAITPMNCAIVSDDARGQAAHLLPVLPEHLRCFGRRSERDRWQNLSFVVCVRSAILRYRQTWRRCTPGAVCSVNNVIAYYLSQEFGPALREIICRISIPDGFSLGSTRWMVISKTKDCSGLLVVWPTRRIRTGY